MLSIFIAEFLAAFDHYCFGKFSIERRRKCCRIFLKNFWLHSTTTVLGNFLLKEGGNSAYSFSGIILGLI